MATTRGGLTPTAWMETERKFHVHGLFKLPDLVSAAWVLAEPVAAELSATYFDTDDLRLTRWRVSLRRREGGEDEGWHLKLPVAAETREELRLPLTAGTLAAPPVALTDLVLALTRTASVREVVTLRTERTTYGLVSGDGSTLASLTDDSVSVLDRSRTVARFRELEVELVDAGGVGDGLLSSVEEQLVAAGAVRGGQVSKVGRSLGPQASAEADVPEPAAVHRSAPAGLAVQAHLRRNSRALLTHDRGVRRDLPDSVHQMRVAARRLRSGLRVFAPIVIDEPSRRLRNELAWLADVLGEVRDREMLRDRLLAGLDALAADQTTDLDPTAAKRLIRSTYAKDLASARARTLEALRSPRYLTLLDELVNACGVPPLTDAAQLPCSEVLPPLVRRAWKRLSRDIEALDVAGPDTDWHEARIAAKRARYACEAVEPIFGKPARRLAGLVEQVTELLGGHQDATLAASAVRALADRDRLAGSTGFALGVLHSAERDAAARARADLFDLWPEVSRGRHRRWLEPGKHR